MGFEDLRERFQREEEEVQHLLTSSASERLRRFSALEEEESELLDRYLKNEDPATELKLHEQLAAIQCSMMALNIRKMDV